MSDSGPRKPTLAEQREAVENLINIAIADGVVGEDLVYAKQACLTLAWIERSSELIKMISELRRESPELFDVLSNISSAFPGVKIAAIRGRPVQKAEDLEYDSDDS